MSTLRLTYCFRSWRITSTDPSVADEEVDSFEAGLARLADRADAYSMDIVVACVNGK